MSTTGRAVIGTSRGKSAPPLMLATEDSGRIFIAQLKRQGGLSMGCREAMQDPAESADVDEADAIALEADASSVDAASEEPRDEA